MKKSAYLLLFIFLALLLSAGCATVPTNGADQRLKTVAEYRRRCAENPSDYGLTIKLREAEMDAAQKFYESGRKLEDQGRLEEAVQQYREGLAAMPGNEKLSNALRRASDKQEAETLYRRALALDQAGREEEARDFLARALADDPGHEDAKALQRKMEERQQSNALAPSFRGVVSLHFDHTDLKAAFDFIGKSFGLNVVFDRRLKDQKVDFSAEDIGVEQALDLIMGTTHTFYKRMDARTILVADDTKENREAYDDLVTKTLHLNSAKAEEMAALLKTVLDFKHIGFDKDSNTLLIRAPQEVLELVEKIIAANDRPHAEVLLDVEILEVNRTKEEQFGLDYGSVITYSAPAASTLDAYKGKSLASILSQGTLTLPSGTFNYLKKDVGARTLAHPQVRVMTSEEAKIHIGDKVPLPTSVVQQTTGGVQTSYSYTDIGVLLDVIPVVNPDRTVQVKLKLEVSSLGSNLGTTDSPAYEIGTRDAQTTMLLHDGETAVMGGLIKDRDSKTRLKVPLLGDIPLLGNLFTTYVDDDKDRTDLLLTITPRILRDWTVPWSVQEVYSGTESVPSGREPSDVYRARPTASPIPQATAVVPTATKVSVSGNAQGTAVPMVSTPNGVGK